MVRGKIVDIEDYTFKNLEFFELLKIISKYTSSNLTKNKIKSLRPTTNILSINSSHQFIEALKNFHESGKDINISEVDFLFEKIEELKINQNLILSPRELVNFSGIFKKAKKIKSELKEFLKDKDYKNLKNLVNSIPDLSYISKKIGEKISQKGEIIEENYPPLKNVRVEIVKIQEKIKTEYEKILNHAIKDNIAADNYITIRNNRYVIPIKANFIGSIKGIVHATSSSGATLFIEPENLISFNNKLLTLYEKEKELIKKLLMSLTNLIRDSLDEVNTITKLLIELDKYMAIGKFSSNFKCIKPEITAEEVILLENGRHPLLEYFHLKNRKKVVPISMELKDGKRCLMISGPNTGGKTAALKTIGLLSLMALSGLFVPADDFKIPGFYKVIAQIGDNQSIEKDLSTFSFYINFMKEVLKEKKSPLLILIDEAGTTTSQEDGAALSIALIREFNERKWWSIITTHNTELKHFGLTSDICKSASVKFDLETLTPYYELIFDSAGTSNAISIAEKLGLEKKIVEEAKKVKKSIMGKPEELLLRLNQLLSEKERELLETKKIKNDEILKKIKLEREIEKRKKEIRKELLDKIKKLESEFKKEKEKFFEKIDIEISKERKKLIKRREEKLFETFKEKISSSEISDLIPFDPQSAYIGMPLYSKDLKKEGNLIKVEKKFGVLDIEGKKLKLPLKKLFMREKDLKKNKIEENTKIVVELPEFNRAKREIDVRGETVLDAISIIEKFLDDALLSEEKEVAIIHGIGTGALKKGIHEFLKSQNFVKRFYHPPQKEGGEGKTIVEL